ncbi:hypothetical protein BFC16_12795 [Pseudoalteromonas sp. JW3]|nr:hypothetical protein BFC16_12795 [Pseudoalteromonas sp. JW3]
MFSVLQYMSRLKRLFRYRAFGMFVACVVLLGIVLIFILDSHTYCICKKTYSFLIQVRQGI